MSSNKKKIGIYTPCFNEEESILECYKCVRETIEAGLPEYEYEHLFIDNSSEDRTVELLKGIALNDKRVKIIVNSRNYGHERSPYHAFLQVNGDVVILVLADLQTPPQTIIPMVKLWEKGFDLVLACYKDPKEKKLIDRFRGLFYKLNGILLEIETHKNFMGFGAYDRKIVDKLKTIKEPDPFFRGLIAEVGFKKAFVEYDKPPRRLGKSKNNFFHLYEVALNGITKYSTVPLKFMTIFGFVASTISFSIGLIYLFLKLLFWHSFPIGMVPTLIAVFFFSAVQMICFGIIGEYLALIMKYVRNYPLVIEKERINF